MTTQILKNLMQKLQTLHQDIHILLMTPGIYAQLNPFIRTYEKEIEVLIVYYVYPETSYNIPDDIFIKNHQVYRCKFLQLHQFAALLEQADITAVHITTCPFTIASTKALENVLTDMLPLSHFFSDGYVHKHYQDILQQYHESMRKAQQNTSNKARAKELSYAFYWAAVLELFHLTKDLETSLLLVGYQNKVANDIRSIKSNPQNMLKNKHVINMQHTMQILETYANRRSTQTTKDKELASEAYNYIYNFIRHLYNAK